MPDKNIGMKKKKLPYLQFLGLFWLAVFIIGFTGLLTGTASAENGETEKDKGAPMMKVCAECHEDMVTAFKGSRHGIIKADCTDCHGNGAKHIEEGGEAGTILGFRTETAIQKTKQCLTCHNKDAGQYMSGPHARAAMDCTQCHSVHNKSYMSHPSKLCASCHQDVFAEFQLNERHRLYEGILECTSCHDPHGPVIRVRLSGAFKNQTCLKCHTDKSGPFLYEHEASLVEGCTICHETHGSPNRHMLKTQRVGDLCFSCHTAAVSWHARFAVSETNCTNCHSAIHGSNLDKLFLK